MKNIKNILIALLASLSITTVSAAPLNRTVTILPSGFTNLLSTLPVNGGALITQFTITSTTTNASRIRVFDTPTNSMTYSNASYTIPFTYATNYVTIWTNYFGVTNSFTNVAIIDTTTTVAASTNLYPVRFTGISPTNTSTVYDGAYTFINGLWATNESVGGTVTVTITGQQ